MIIQKQILKSKNELQSSIQKTQFSKIILYNDVNKKSVESIIKDWTTKKYTIIVLEK